MTIARVAAFALMLATGGFWHIGAFAADDGVALDRARYANRPQLPDFTGTACPDNPRGLEQINGDLYRHTTGPD